jgi:hypothetical protein
MLTSPINPLTKFGWSWQNAKERAKKGMVWGLMLGIIFGLVSSIFITNNIASDIVFSIRYEPYRSYANSTLPPLSSFDRFILIIFHGLNNSLISALIAQPICALGWAIVGGYRRDSIADTTKPNQGIWRSAIRSLTLAVVAMSLYAIYFTMELLNTSEQYRAGIAEGQLNFTIIIGLMIALFSGVVCIKHFVLRILLSSSGKIPWNYAKFLNYSTNSILLQKIGGGYVFAHRLLLEHFSEMYNERG